MRHLKRGRKLGRNASHRKAMFRNMANSLFEHEEIVTTVAKAKALRPFVERMITIARRGAMADRDAKKHRAKVSSLDKKSPDRAAVSTEWRQAEAPVLHARRRLISYLGNHRLENDEEHSTVIQKLIEVIGPRFVDRPGGYTRILKLTKRRLGDAGHTALIALVRDDDRPTPKRRRKDAQAHAESDAPDKGDAKEKTEESK